MDAITDVTFSAARLTRSGLVSLKGLLVSEAVVNPDREFAGRCLEAARELELHLYPTTTPR